MCESEYATDVMFGDPARLAALYPRLIQHALLSFGSRDVLRFLGHRVHLQGPIHPKFAGQVLTDLKARPEGVGLKHRVGSNSLNMYDKFGRGLRVETTINNPRLRKVPHSHRYHLTPKGRTVITALLTARQADTTTLTAMAA